MSLFRALRRDYGNAGSRIQLVQALLRNIPGETGILLRRGYLRRHLAAVGDGLVIYEGARIYGPQGLRVGHRCRIGIDNIIQANGGVTLGDDVILGPGVKIWSVNHVFARLDQAIWDQGYEQKPVTIGNGVWIGADCFVMPGATIGDHVVVAAGSVVGGKDVEPYSILAGNPARKIGTRLERASAPSMPAPPALANQAGDTPPV